MTPGGRPLSVRMSNFGPLGWVSDPRGYRYQAIHPETGQGWPDLAVAAIMAALAIWGSFEVFRQARGELAATPA